VIFRAMRWMSVMKLSSFELVDYKLDAGKIETWIWISGPLQTTRCLNLLNC
jgi:hypothetical protein